MPDSFRTSASELTQRRFSAQVGRRLAAPVACTGGAQQWDSAGPASGRRVGSQPDSGGTTVTAALTLAAPLSIPALSTAAASSAADLTGISAWVVDVMEAVGRLVVLFVARKLRKPRQSVRI